MRAARGGGAPVDADVAPLRLQHVAQDLRLAHLLQVAAHQRQLLGDGERGRGRGRRGEGARGLPEAVPRHCGGGHGGIVPGPAARTGRPLPAPGATQRPQPAFKLIID